MDGIPNRQLVLVSVAGLNCRGISWYPPVVTRRKNIDGVVPGSSRELTVGHSRIHPRKHSGVGKPQLPLICRIVPL